MITIEQETSRSQEQPKTEKQRKLVERAQMLFRAFYDEAMPRRTRFAEYRRIRALEEDVFENGTAPKLNVLGSMIDTVVADQMDNPLEALMIPERPDEETVRSADDITDVVRFALDQCGWDAQYRKLMEDTATLGTGVAEVLWEADADDGRGLVRAMRVKPENFFPDPAYENIQDGRAVFKATWVTVAWVEEHFPHVKGYIAGDEYANDGDGEKLAQAQGESEGCMLLDYWYKQYDAEARRTRVHMALICGNTLVYTSEEDDDMKDGVYAHGLYPFVVFPYRERAGSAFGMGMMDDYAEQYFAVCRYFKYMDDNTRLNAKPRFLARRGEVDEIADMERDFVEVENLEETHIKPIVVPALGNQVFTTVQYLVDTMKQDSGQNQFTRGEGGMGVTAASAIQALQEAGGKTARMHTSTYKEAFRQMIMQIVWVLADYIDAQRVLLVTGDEEVPDTMHSVTIRPSARKPGGGIEKPPYTIRVQVQKKNPLQIQANNQYVLQIAQVCGEAGAPLPPAAVVRLLQGQDNKAQILRELQAADQTQAQIAQLTAQLEQAQAQMEQLAKQNGLQKQVITRQHQELAAQRAPGQVNAPNYGMLNTTVGVNREEL